jgi:hypothetical protein
MRAELAVLFMLLMAGTVMAELTTEGGNISAANVSSVEDTHYWSAIVGNLNSSPVHINTYISVQDTPNRTVFENSPNGSYIRFYNATLLLTRLNQKPELESIYSPSPSDFNSSGMFSTFGVFSLSNYTLNLENPYVTFKGATDLMVCYIYDLPFVCPYVTLAPDIKMGVLLYNNGTIIEPLFIESIISQTGYNGSLFDFEYMVPALERYYFYIMKPQICNMTVYIDGVQTTTFPKTGVPYDVEVLVRDNTTLEPLPDVRVDSVEENGRNLLYPLIDLGRRALGEGYTQTDSGGIATFALSPTRYNIPDAYNYIGYIMVNHDGFICRQNLTIANYGSLSPTYRSSLVDGNYASQVKSSTQNTNALASTASRWVSQGKMRVINVVAYTNGTYDPLPTLKAGAPNLMNITVYNSTDMSVVTVNASVLEKNGQIIFVPQQPPANKTYENAESFDTDQTAVLIPTRYNNQANLTIMYGNGVIPFGVLSFPVDTVLENPAAGDADMDPALQSEMSSALQNINSILANIVKSLSTV